MSDLSPTARRIPVEGPLSDEEIELFGEYRALVPLVVLGEPRWVPEHNTVLRALQYLELREGAVRLDWGRYCWNDTKGCCALWVRAPDEEAHLARACRTPATEGLELVSLPAGGRRC